MAIHNKFFMFFTLYFFTLTPYLKFTSGYIHTGMISVAIIVALCSMKSLKSWFFAKDFVILSFVMFSLYLLSGFLGVVFGSGFFGYNSYYFNIFSYVLAGYLVGNCLQGFKLSSNDRFVTHLLHIFVLIAFVNSSIIIMEFFTPSLKSLLEGFLFDDPGSNIDYESRWNRLRGFSSGGGANLSLYMGMACFCGLYLYLIKRIKFTYFLLLFLVTFSAMALVGRTGFLIFVVSCLLLFSYSFLLNPLRVSKVGLGVFGFLILFISSIPFVFSAIFPKEIVQYSIDLYYNGVEGLKNEGTLSLLTEMINSPSTISQAVLGVGNGSGGFQDGLSADIGYLKSFTAIGLPLSILLYCYFVYVFYRAFGFSKYKDLFFVLVVMMFVSELKEPLLFKGYSARMIWFLVGLMMAFRLWRKGDRNMLASG